MWLPMQVDIVMRMPCSGAEVRRVSDVNTSVECMFGYFSLQTCNHTWEKHTPKYPKTNQAWGKSMMRGRKHYFSKFHILLGLQRVLIRARICWKHKLVMESEEKTLTVPSACACRCSSVLLALPQRTKCKPEGAGFWKPLSKATPIRSPTGVGVGDRCRCMDGVTLCKSRDWRIACTNKCLHITVYHIWCGMKWSGLDFSTSIVWVDFCTDCEIFLFWAILVPHTILGCNIFFDTWFKSPFSAYILFDAINRRVG